MNKLNNKGFTLVELLATIVVLGIISTIAFISVDRMIDHSQITECENVLLRIKTAAKEYVSDKRFDSDMATLESFTVSALISEGFLTSEIKNPFNTGNVDSSKLRVIVTLNDDYTYESADIIYTTSGKMITCSEDVKEDTHVRFPGE